MHRSPSSWAGALAMVLMASGPAPAQTAKLPEAAATQPAKASDAAAGQPVKAPAADAAAAEPATFTLDVAAAAAQDVTLTVQSPSRIPFKIIHGGGAVSGKAMLDLSPFINDQGVVQTFGISVGNAAAEGKDHVGDIAFDSPVLTATLNVPKDLPTGSKYTGRLILTAPGQAQPIVWRLLLT